MSPGRRLHAFLFTKHKILNSTSVQDIENVYREKDSFIWMKGSENAHIFPHRINESVT